MKACTSSKHCAQRPAASSCALISCTFIAQLTFFDPLLSPFQILSHNSNCSTSHRLKESQTQSHLSQSTAPIHPGRIRSPQRDRRVHPMPEHNAVRTHIHKE